MSPRKPLARASARLRARRGRPSAGHSAGHSVPEVRGATGRDPRALADLAAAPLRPRLLQVEDGARYLAVSTKTLRRWIAEGRVPVVRLAGFRRPLVEVAALDALVDGAKLGPVTAPGRRGEPLDLVLVLDALAARRT